MDRCGFRAKGLFVMDGSRRSAHANAYFTGLGASKRVVFFDTLLKKLSHGEVEAVLAHELGHFKHKRAQGAWSLAMSVAGCPAGLAVSPSLVLPGPGREPQPAPFNDALALLLFMLVPAPVPVLCVTHLLSTSRRDEYQADAYALPTSRARRSGQRPHQALTKTTQPR